MDVFAVAVIPVVKVDEWLKFCGETADGERAEAHRDFLKRGGVTREHVFRQRTPSGDLMILVWEGVDLQQQAARMVSLLDRPANRT